MDYLLKARPDAGRERALFLTLQAPFRPLTSSAIGMIVRSRANRLGITGKRLGAHALRHAAAQRLVDEGCGLKTVGDFLGHSSPSATAAYAKIALASLRPVADICLKELLDDTCVRPLTAMLRGSATTARSSAPAPRPSIRFVVASERPGTVTRWVRMKSAASLSARGCSREHVPSSTEASKSVGSSSAGMF